MRKPVLLWKGLRRQMLNKLRNAINSLKGIDVNTVSVHQLDPSDTPDQFFAGTSNITAAMTTLLNRVDYLKQAKG